MCGARVAQGSGARTFDRSVRGESLSAERRGGRAESTCSGHDIEARESAERRGWRLVGQAVFLGGHGVVPDAAAVASAPYGATR